jgi:type II secretory pathway pseudopilin PulG
MKTMRTGYILLELVIALTMFSISVLGLAKALTATVDVANLMDRENAIRIGLRSFLEEARKKPATADMAMSAVDERLGVTFASIIEPLGLQNSEGRNLADLYSLTATATYTVGNESREETATVYVYSPQQNQRR